MKRSDLSELRRQKRREAGLPVGKDPSRLRCESLARIAQLLDCEGFNEYAAQCVFRYARHQGVVRDDDYKRRKQAFGDAMRTLTPEQARAVGRFLSIQVRCAFDAALRLGLMSYIEMKEGETQE